MKYKLVVTFLRSDFEKAVTKYLNEGWKLYKRPFIHDGRYHQAMTKE